MPEFALSSVLTAAGAAAGGIVVASVAQMLKPILPELWQHGRAMIAVVYVLAALLVAAAVASTPELTSTLGFAELAFVVVMSWQAVAAAAIGSNQVARKGEAIVRGTTDEAGPDTAGARTGPA